MLQQSLIRLWKLRHGDKNDFFFIGIQIMNYSHKLFL